MGLLDQGGLLLGTFLCGLLVKAFSQELLLQSLHLLTIMLVEGHVVVADEMIALLATRLRSFSVAPFLPSQHRLADMDATVVDDIGFHHLVAVGRHDLRQRPSQEVVAHMTEMERLVGVG